MTRLNVVIYGWKSMEKVHALDVLEHFPIEVSPRLPQGLLHHPRPARPTVRYLSLRPTASVSRVSSWGQYPRPSLTGPLLMSIIAGGSLHCDSLCSLWSVHSFSHACKADVCYQHMDLMSLITSHVLFFYYVYQRSEEFVLFVWSTFLNICPDGQRECSSYTSSFISTGRLYKLAHWLKAFRSVV